MSDRPATTDGDPERATRRDRRPDGRPEQARPRDLTGRPLPWDTDETELTEEHDPSTLDEALELGVGLWGQQRYFEAHECLEHVWHQSPEVDRDFWKGVIQVAVAGVHLQRANPDGAVALFRRAADHLEGAPAVHHGIRTDDLIATARAAADAVEAAGWVGAAGLPVLLLADGGAYVGDDPADPPVPVEDREPWQPKVGPAAVDGSRTGDADGETPEE